MRRRRLADRPHRPEHRPAPWRLRRRHAELEGGLRRRTTASPRRSTRASPARRSSTGAPFWTGDYVADPRFPHLRAVDDYLEASAITLGHGRPAHRRDRAVRRAARRRAGGRTPGPRTTPDLLQAIADQAAITIRTTRLIDALGQSRMALARRAERRAGAARDRRPDHRPARTGRHPARCRDPGRPPGRRGRGHPRPARPGHRQPALGVRRRPGGDVQRPRSGRSSGSRSGSAPPAPRSPRAASSSPTATSPRSSRHRPNRPSSTSGPASSR